jgi:hypothetical protein
MIRVSYVLRPYRAIRELTDAKHNQENRPRAAEADVSKMIRRQKNPERG